MTEAKLRVAVDADFEDILELYSDLAPDGGPLAGTPQIKSLWKKLLAQRGTYVCVAERDGQIVASCTLLFTPGATPSGKPHAMIDNAVTRLEVRGEGYGNALLDFAIGKAREMGADKVMLLSGRADPGVHAFYREAGPEQQRAS